MEQTKLRAPKTIFRWGGLLRYIAIFGIVVSGTLYANIESMLYSINSLPQKGAPITSSLPSIYPSASDISQQASRAITSIQPVLPTTSANTELNTTFQQVSEKSSPIETMYAKEPEIRKFDPKNVKVSSDPLEIEIESNIPIRQYGYSFFSGPGSPLTNYGSQVSSDYIVGIGDSLLIRIWGKIEEQFSATVDNNGSIFIPKVGMVPVAGLPYSQVSNVIKRELSKNYVNFQVSVTLGSGRPNKIFVLGEVKFPGAFDLPVKSNLMSALYSAGGPTKSGSMRKIQLIRNRQVIKTIDLYDYLMSADQSQDPTLQNFDTIFVPLIGNTVKVDGIVKRPAIFEIQDGDTLYTAVQVMGGGTGINYYAKRVQVERIVEGQKRVIMDFSFSDAAQFKSGLKTEKLKNGDIITVFPIYSKRFNEINIQGNVTRPGVYELEQGMTLGELIKKADGFLKDAYLHRIDIYRQKSESEWSIIAVDYTNNESAKLKLNEFDTILVRSKQTVEGVKTVKVIGAVENSGQFLLLDGQRVLDLAYMANVLPNADLSHAELARTNPDGSKNIININLEQIRQNPNSSENYILKNMDQLFIQENAKKTQTATVAINGQVRFPGTYVIRDGDRLTDIITRAGGLAPKGYLPGLVFKRQIVEKLQQDSKNYILNEEYRKIMLNPDRIKSLESPGYQNLYTKILQERTITTNIENLGRLILNITTLDQISPEYNIEINNGDSIFIPEIPTSVQISGGVQNAGAHVFIPGRNVKFYINACGGYTTYAQPSQILIIRASGEVLREGGEGMQVAPGDTIYIPEEIKIPFDWVGGFFEFSKFLVNTLTSVVLVKSLL